MSNSISHLAGTPFSSEESELDRLRREVAELRSQSNERQLQLITDTIPAFLAYVDANQRYLRVNRSYEVFFGVELDQLLGRTVRDVLGEKRYSKVRPYIEQVLAGATVNFEVQQRRDTGDLNDFQVTYTPERAPDGTVRGFVGMIQDITERKRSEAFEAGQKRSLEMIAEGASLNSILDFLCRQIEAWTHTKGVASILLVDEGTQRLRQGASPSLPESFTQAIDGLPIGPELGACARVAYFGREPITPDIAAGPNWAPFMDIALSHGLKACWWSPILDADGSILGTFALYYPEPGAPNTRARDVVSTVAHTASIAIARKRADDRFQADRLRWKEILLQCPAGIAVLRGPDHVFDWANNEYVRLVGRSSAAELVGKTIAEALPEIPGQVFIGLLNHVYQTGEPVIAQEVPGRLDLAGDGVLHRVYVNFAYLATRNTAGQIDGVFVHFNDVTGIVLTRQRVEESEKQMRVLADTIPQLAWMANPDGSVFWFNQRWYDYTGAAPEQMKGWGWQSAHDPQELPKIMAHWKDAIARGEPTGMVLSLRGADGAFRRFLTRVEPLKDDEGKVLRWFGTNTDIEEQETTQQVLKATEERLQIALSGEQQARRTAELLNRIGPVLSAELDTQRLTQKVTDLATQLTGAEFGSFFHNVVNDQGESYLLYTLSGVPRDAFANFPMPRSTEVFGPTFRGEGVVRSDDITKDPRYGRNAPHRGMPDGHLPVRSYLAASVVSRSGDVLGGLFFGHSKPGVFSVRDEHVVTGIAAQAAIALDNAKLFAQSQKSQSALEHSNAALRRANADLNQFAYSASHDLQEPLRMVAIYSQLMQRKYGSMLDAQAVQYMDYTLQGARRMESLVKDLLTYTQTMAGVDSDLDPVSAANAVQKAIANLHGAIEGSGAELEYDSLPALCVQEVHLLQLFQNLIGNAIKYRGPAPPRIVISSEPEGAGMWKISVRDNGIGIAPEYRQQVFGIFKRLHTSSKYEGTGIGLAICKRIVERYGGRIWVEAAEDPEGSLFCFTLPGAA